MKIITTIACYKFILLLLCLVVSGILANQVSAQGAQGFIFARTTFVGTATCASPDHASVEFVLAERGSTNQITNSIGRWSVNIRNSSLVRTNGASYNGQKVSNPICFDPITEGVQVTVDDSSNYYEFSGPTVLPTGATDLSSMRGYHFRGYIELLPKSISTPDVVSVSPTNGTPFTVGPNFIVSTNRLSSLFNSTALQAIKFYAIRPSTNTLYTEVATAFGGVGTRSVNGFRSPVLPDGIYLWTFHQEFNGYAATLSADRTRSWNFTNLPLSAAPSAQSFMIDSQNLSVNSRRNTVLTSVPASTSTTAEVQYTHRFRDTLSGLESSTIYVTDNSGNIIVAYPTQHRTAGNTYGPTSEIVVTLNLSVQKGQTYRFFGVGSDVAGNISTSTVYTYLVPTSYSVPTLSSMQVDTITSNSARLSAIITSSGGLALQNRGTCWATSSTVVAAGGGTCYSITAAGVPAYRLYDTHTGLPASTTIYYRAFANNSLGTGYSAIDSFNTLQSVTGTSAIVVAPSIEIRPVTNLRSHSATLGSRITGTGGSPITARGICWATSPTLLASMDISTSSANCTIWGTLPTGSVLPYDGSTSFSNLTPGTALHYRVFATNSVGTTDAYGTFTTLDEYHDFVLNAVTATSSYNSVSDDFSVTVDFTQVDQSSYPNQITGITTIVPRAVDYTVRIDIGDDGSYDLTRTGSIESDWYVNSVREYVTFDNVPSGTVKIEVTINIPSSLYPETSSRLTNNTRSLSFFVAKDSTSLVDVVAGTGGGSGSLVVTDPGMVIIAASPIIRTGQQTVISWDTVAPYNMTCTIYGPSNFARVTFNPSVDGTTGTTSSGFINSAQDYLLECYEPVSDSTFRATTRVKTVGVFQEV